MIETTIDRGFVRTSEGQVHYRRHGSGDPFVLMMTLPYNTVMLEPLMRILGKDYDCIALDLLGQGNSDTRQRPFTCEDHARVILEALDGLAIASTRMLGGHLTGQVAVEAAVIAPERIETLFLDGMVAWSLEEGREAAKIWQHARFNMSGQFLASQWDYFVALMRRLDPEYELHAGNMHLSADLGFSFIMEGVGGMGGPVGQGMLDWDLSERARNLVTPTVLIGSPTDTLISQHEKARKLIPNCREFLWEYVNPLYQVDRPERAKDYAAMLLSFL